MSKYHIVGGHISWLILSILTLLLGQSEAIVGIYVPEAISIGQPTSYNRESLAKFENRIEPLVYVRRITHRTMYEKSPLAKTGVRKNITVASGSS